VLRERISSKLEDERLYVSSVAGGRGHFSNSHERDPNAESSGFLIGSLGQLPLAGFF